MNIRFTRVISIRFTLIRLFTSPFDVRVVLFVLLLNADKAFFAMFAPAVIVLNGSFARNDAVDTAVRPIVASAVVKPEISIFAPLIAAPRVADIADASPEMAVFTVEIMPLPRARTPETKLFSPVCAIVAALLPIDRSIEPKPDAEDAAFCDSFDVSVSALERLRRELAA